jgi:hypothetical protein
MNNKLVNKNNKYFQNYQKYSECQLVAVLNASYVLGNRFINPDDEEYEKLVDKTCGRIGACIGIEEIYKYVGLRYIDVKQEWESIKFSMDMNLPISVSINDVEHMGINSNKYGFHNNVIIDMRYNKKRKNYDLQIPNLRYYTNDRMWINWDDYNKMIYFKKHVGPPYGFFRIFYTMR